MAHLDLPFPLFLLPRPGLAAGTRAVRQLVLVVHLYRSSTAVPVALWQYSSTTSRAASERTLIL